MRRDLPRFYPGTSIQITDPFFVIRCRNCSNSYYAITPVSACLFCGSDQIEQAPAEGGKASRKQMLRKDEE